MLARVLTPCSPASSHRARQLLHLHNGRRRPARQERTVRLSRLVSFHTLLLSPQCHTTGPGMAPVLLADAGILATACTNTRAPPSSPCPVSALTRGMVVRVPSKSFSAARKNRRLQRPLTPLVRTLWLLPAHAAAQQRLPACSFHRPVRPLTLHRPRTVDSNGRRRPALAPAPCTSAIDLGVRRS